jgi:hypothetical protein
VELEVIGDVVVEGAVVEEVVAGVVDSRWDSMVDNGVGCPTTPCGQAWREVKREGEKRLCFLMNCCHEGHLLGVWLSSFTVDRFRRLTAETSWSSRYKAEIFCDKTADDRVADGTVLLLTRRSVLLLILRCLGGLRYRDPARGQVILKTTNEKEQNGLVSR